VKEIAAAQRTIAVLLAGADGAVLVLAGLAAAWLRFPGAYFFKELDKILEHPGFIAFTLALLWALGSTFDLYRPEQWRELDQLLVRLTAMAIALPIGMALGVYIVLPWRFGRGLLLMTLVIAVPCLLLIRLLWLKAAKLPKAHKALVIGEGPIVEALMEELARRPSPPFEIIKHLRDPDQDELDPATSEKMATVEKVIVANLNHEQTVDRLAELNFFGTSVIDAAGAYAALTGRIPVLQVDSRWFIATGDFSSLAGSPFHRVKRILDLIVALLLLILSAPVLLVALLLLLIIYGRPLLYRQQRLGQFRKPFTLLKLRTMEVNAEPNGPEFTAPADERVHALGRLFRRWRVDELPQLINVLRGDMSLVGPRPERPEVASDLERKIPFFAFRYSVKPGLTGWAQVNLPYCSETNEHLTKLEFDLYSLRHYGPGMYLLVMLRTLGALVLRPGR
jgi:lipopolysaccharide/colanic/teichoic acid biosynthesis glycosyltransferase